MHDKNLARATLRAPIVTIEHTLITYQGGFPMRKILVAAAAALSLVGAGLAAAPAVAAGYEGTVATTTSVSVKSATYGKSISATVKVKSGDGVPAGKVTVKIGKTSKTATLKNGSATVKFGKLAAGKYTVSGSYAGSGIWKSSKAGSKSITIKKAKTTVKASKISLKLGKKSTLYVKASKAGKVTVTIKRGKYTAKKTITVKAGKTTKVTLKKLGKTKGKYTVKVSFTPKSSNYSKSSTTKKITVKK